MTSDSSSKMHSITALVVAVIIAVGLIIAAVIISKGDYGRAMESTSGAVSQSLKAMEQSMTMDVMLQMGEQKEMQSMSYDHGANVVIVDAPANVNGSTAATIVLDYDKSLIFISVDHSEKVCVGSTLDDKMSTAIVDFMETNKEDVIDVATAILDSASFVQQEIIPRGYVAVSNGPIIGSLCSERDSYWTEKRGSTSAGGRRRRAIGPLNIMFCVWRLCFDIDIDFN